MWITIFLPENWNHASLTWFSFSKKTRAKDNLLHRSKTNKQKKVLFTQGFQQAWPIIEYGSNLKVLCPSTGIFWCVSLSVIVTHFVVTLEKVIEIWSVDLWCLDDAKALPADCYSLSPGLNPKPLKMVECPAFLARVHHYFHCCQRDFFSSTLIFFFLM